MWSETSTASNEHPASTGEFIANLLGTLDNAMLTLENAPGVVIGSCHALRGVLDNWDPEMIVGQALMDATESESSDAAIEELKAALHSSEAKAKCIKAIADLDDVPELLLAKIQDLVAHYTGK